MKASVRLPCIVPSPSTQTAPRENPGPTRWSLILCLWHANWPSTNVQVRIDGRKRWTPADNHKHARDVYHLLLKFAAYGTGLLSKPQANIVRNVGLCLQIAPDIPRPGSFPDLFLQELALSFSFFNVGVFRSVALL